MPTQTTVTGRVFTSDNVAATSGTVEFKLRPASTGILYRIAGTGIIAPLVTIATIDATGYIKNAAGTGALQLWGNPAILPANTLYDATFFPNGVKTQVITKLLISGATYDLATPTFGTQVSITPATAIVPTGPLDANLIPSVDDIFVIGSNSKRYASIYANHIIATDITGASIATLTSYAKAALPAAGTAGKLARLSDTNRGVWMDNGTQWSPINAVFNVRDFGATGDGTTDDTAAITAAAAALQANGGGTLYFPAPTVSYVICTGWTAGQQVMCRFTGLNGVRVIGDGAYIVGKMDATPASGVIGTMFSFGGCTNIEVDGFKVYQARTSPCIEFGGLWFVNFDDGSKNISMPNNYLEGTYVSVGCVRHTLVPTDYTVENLHIGNLYVKNCYYGLSFQNSGNNVVIDNLMTDDIGRSYFPYGCHHHRVRIENINQHIQSCDVLLRAGGGYGDLYDIDLSYVNRTGNCSGSFIWILFENTAGLIRNIRINLDIVTTAAGPNYGVYISADTANQNHRLTGLTISGRVEGDVTIKHPVTGLAGTDSMRGIAIRDYVAANNTNDSTFDITRLVDSLIFENVYHATNFLLTGTAPSTLKISYLNFQTVAATIPFVLSALAPSMQLTDLTAAAKSLLVSVDANKADFLESAGAAGSLLTLDLANNRVGVATAAPTVALDVTGAVAISSTLAVTGTITGTLATAAQTAITSVGTLASLTVTGAIVNDTTTFVTDVSNNRVGIGTATPTVPLDVVGAIKGSTTINAGTTITAGTTIVAGTSVVAGTGFGCNSKAAQTAYETGAALAAYADGTKGLASTANMEALVAKVNAIEAALIANGICS